MVVKNQFHKRYLGKKMRDQFLHNRRSRVPAPIRQTTWRNQMEDSVIWTIHRREHYLKEKRKGSKFSEL